MGHKRQLLATTAGLVFSTTDGRDKLPDHLQRVYGDKVLLGFSRYTRAIGALIPMEAVAMLAKPETVEPAMRDRIQRHANALLKELGYPD